MSPAFVDGMCLVAIARGDRDGSAAAGLGARLSAALGDALAAHAQSDERTRRNAVRGWAEALGAVAEQNDLPAPARALLAADVPRELGRRWMAEASPVRRGFRSTAGLRATLRRYVGAPDPDAAERERAAGEALDGDARARWQALGLGTDTRVLGALALGADSFGQGDEAGGDAHSRLWRRVGRSIAQAREASWLV